MGSRTLWVELLIGILQQTLLLGFALQFLNLHPQPFVFLHLVLEESHGDARLFLHAARGEQVGISKLVFVIAEVADLEAAFCDQRIQAKIDFAKADAQPFRQISLRKAGIIFQRLEQTVMCGFV